MAFSSTRRIRNAAFALTAALTSLVAVSNESPPVAAAGNDCVAINPSGNNFTRERAQVYRTDGSLVGEMPISRTVTADGIYADYRASSDPSVDNLIVVGDLATGREEIVFELPRDLSSGRYIDGLQLSPNGEYLSFTLTPDGAFRSELRVIDLDGNVTVESDFDIRPEDAVFSPDSTKIVYSDDTFALGRDVWIAATDGATPPERLLDAPPDFVVGPHAIPQNAGDFSWSPDGTKVTFEGRNGNSNGMFGAAAYEGYIVDVDTAVITQFPSVFVGQVETDQRNPVWSPDGTKIAFQQEVFDGRADPDSGRTIAIYDVVADSVTNVPGSTGLLMAPQGVDKYWTSDDLIVFNGTRNTSSGNQVNGDGSRQDGAFSVAADGSGIEFIAPFHSDRQPIELSFITGLISCDAVPVEAYSGLAPERIMDTRDGTGVRAGFVGAGETITLPVGGAGGVPDGADAVALNVTVAQTSTRSFLSVFPNGVSRPNASNLNWDGPGVTKASTVIVKLGDGGGLDFYNDAGNVHLIADVAGWFADGAGFTAITPRRFLDTRTGEGVSPPGRLNRGSLTLPIHGNIVPSSATGVIMNVTAAGVTDQSFLTAYPSGLPDPGTSNLNVFPGVTSANVVFSQIGSNGAVDIANVNGASHVIADVAGYLSAESGFEGSEPRRILDTRTTRPFRSFETQELQLRGVPGGVPDSARVAVLNVTALRSSQRGFLTVFPDGTPPNASNVNFAPGEIVPNLVIARIGDDGAVRIFNQTGGVDVVVDVLGWFN